MGLQKVVITVIDCCMKLWEPDWAKFEVMFLIVVVVVQKCLQCAFGIIQSFNVIKLYWIFDTIENSHFAAETDCAEGEVHLVGGETDREGDVQICHNGVWGYTCGFNFYYEEARVVCQQLNFSTSCERVLQKEIKPTHLIRILC